MDGLHRGPRAAGRPRAAVDVAPVVPVAIHEDLAEARNQVAPVAGVLPRCDGRQGEELLRRARRALRPSAPARARCRSVSPAGDRVGSATALTDELIDAGTIATTPAGLDARLAEYEAAGVDTLVAVPCGDRPAVTRRSGGGGRPGMTGEPVRPEGITGSELPGPYPVGAYAARLRDFLRARARVQVFGEVWNFKIARTRAFTSSCATPTARCRARCGATAARRSACPTASLADGTQVVVGGGPDYYPGSAHGLAGASRSTSARCASPARATCSSQLARAAPAPGRRGPLRAAEGACPGRRSRGPIGVVTGESGKARDDVLAGLRRRGWAGRLVWAFAPVQDRRAAPAITRALQDLAAIEEVDVVIVARGGGSLADLFAFCDETLCRTVALLRVPVIASVGHHTDRTLIDDVAAVSARPRRTPPRPPSRSTSRRGAHAGAQLRRAAGLARAARRRRARAAPGADGRASPGEHVARNRRALHQQLRELRAAGDATRRARARAHRARAPRCCGARPRAGGRSRARRPARAALERPGAGARGPRPASACSSAATRIVDDREGGLVTSAERRARAAGAVRQRSPTPAVDARIEE